MKCDSDRTMRLAGCAEADARADSDIRHGDKEQSDSAATTDGARTQTFRGESSDDCMSTHVMNSVG